MIPNLVAVLCLKGNENSRIFVPLVVISGRLEFELFVLVT